MGSRFLEWVGRRWWAFLLALALSATAGYAATTKVAPVYRAERQVLFTVPPTYQDPDVKVNPFLNFDANLTTALDVVSISVTSPQVAAVLAPEGSGISYEAGPSTTTTAPVMVIAVEAPSPPLADRTADALVERSTSVLEGQQKAAGAPRSTWVADTLIASSAEPTRVWSKTVQMGIAGAAAGLMLGLIFIALLLRRDLRRSRRARASQSGPTLTPSDGAPEAADSPAAQAPDYDEIASAEADARSLDELEPAVHAFRG